MPQPGSSPSSAILSRLLPVAFATLVVALAFGADFGFGDGPDGSTQWTKGAGGGGIGSVLPWSNAKVRRKGTALQEAKVRLSDERKRRAESDKSLSFTRARLSEVEASNESMQARIAALESELLDRESKIMDLRADVARASAASPEMVDQFLSLADEAIREARFETALALSVDASKMLRSLASGSNPGRVARLEFIRATALVAMGDEAGAAQSLERVLEVAPDFDLDESNSSPKLVRVLQEILAERV